MGFPLKAEPLDPPIDVSLEFLSADIESWYNVITHLAEPQFESYEQLEDLKRAISQVNQILSDVRSGTSKTYDFVNRAVEVLRGVNKLLTGDFAFTSESCPECQGLLDYSKNLISERLEAYERWMEKM